MLKITPSRLEHIEMAECCYFIRGAHCRIRIMKEITENLECLVKKVSKFYKFKGGKRAAKKCGKDKK